MLVYKYRSGSDSLFDRDVTAITGNTFWAASAKDLNDPCESFVDLANVVPEFENYAKAKGKDAAPEAMAFLRKQFVPTIARFAASKHLLGILSLSKTYADELLWAHYANAHTGFCVEYDSQFLRIKGAVV